jgi:hypothetical protein
MSNTTSERGPNQACLPACELLSITCPCKDHIEQATLISHKLIKSLCCRESERSEVDPLFSAPVHVYISAIDRERFSLSVRQFCRHRVVCSFLNEWVRFWVSWRIRGWDFSGTLEEAPKATLVYTVQRAFCYTGSYSTEGILHVFVQFFCATIPFCVFMLFFCC